MPAFKNIRSLRFGRWTVIDYTGQSYWHCRCDCGFERAVHSQSLRKGTSISCGCFRKEFAQEHMRGVAHALIHGHAVRGRMSSAYSRWRGMIQRCTNPSDRYFHRYGGRGITVCERWHEFPNFLADLGEPPPGLTLDRIDNDGNYEPGNCRWATPKEQSANQRPRRHRQLNKTRGSK